MNRLDFMKRLEMLLSDISESEREEALQYYNDYLNDAGVENEQEVLEALGTPEQLAKIIKDGLNDNGSVGEFTETGYKNENYEKEVKNEIAKKLDKKSISGGMIVLIVILCIFAAPFLIAIASGIFGAGAGILFGILGLFVGVAAAGIALAIAAVALIGIGIVTSLSVPLAGVCLIGAGILLAGLAIFFIWLTVWLYGMVIPWAIRGIVNVCSRLFHKKGGENA